MTTPNPERCQHIAIANSQSGHVTVCLECSIVNVSINNLSLRFTPEVFRDVAHMLAAAQARLDHVREASTAAAALIDAARSGGPSVR
jgi:hypothetical protein